MCLCGDDCTARSFVPEEGKLLGDLAREGGGRSVGMSGVDFE